MPSKESSTREYDTDSAIQVLHWYDFLCPFCYVGQGRDAIFEAHGMEVVSLPFEAHPDIPAHGRIVGPRSAAMVAHIEEEARTQGLPLAWPRRLPNTRMALAAAEWVRRTTPDAFPAFQQALFAAHFARGEDLGDRDVVETHAARAGVDIAAMRAALDNGAAHDLVGQSEALARRLGIRGTPAWYVAGRLIPGLYPREQFEKLARALSMGVPAA